MENQPPAFTNLIDLASERLGGKTLICSDDFFAPMENLIKPGRGIFIENKYTDHGKWMDGWESRRKRTPGNDWCILRLGAEGVIKGVDIDTNHFLGNHPPFASIDGLLVEEEPDWNSDAIQWKNIVEKSDLKPGDHNFFEIQSNEKYSHLRLNIFPDGGVARLKVYGEVVKNSDINDKKLEIDLAAAINGGKCIACNDMFFSDKNNLIMPGPGLNMGDGWETKRNRNAGNRDWVIVKLAGKGIVSKIIVDTSHFKGNYPDSCSLEGIDIPGDIEVTSSNEEDWTTIVSNSKLGADQEHIFQKEIVNKGPFTHIRLNIFPDGGVSRLRIIGYLS